MPRRIITHKSKIAQNENGQILNWIDLSTAYHWFDFSKSGDTVNSGVLEVAKNYGYSGIDLFNSKVLSPGATPSVVNSNLITKTFSGGMTWAHFATSSSTPFVSSPHMGTSSTSFNDIGTTFIVAKGGSFIYTFSFENYPGEPIVNRKFSQLKTQSGGFLDYIDTYGIQFADYPQRLLRTNMINNNFISVHQYDITQQNSLGAVQTTLGKLNGINAVDTFVGFYQPDVVGYAYFQLGTTHQQNMQIGEFIHFDYALTNYEIDFIENYLKNKWGISY